jgi:hypothetical protein
MAVLMTAEVPGMTPEAYDGMLAGTGMTDALRQAKGFIAHAAGMSDGVWRVTEIWESQEDSARWFAEHVQPSLPEGIQPKRVFRQLHNLIRP